MQTVIVVPCLNEACLIERTTRSLGFGANCTTDKDTRLILVDNGSTDDTWTKISAIRDHSPPGTVIVAREEDRGYVPPRHRGALIASELAAKEHVSPEDFLILQADADTVYEPGYVLGMQRATLIAGQNSIIEGSTRSSRRFLHDHPGFQELADLVDQEMAPLAVDTDDDVIIDDKVAGYRLGDYLRWGGHRRDYMSTGAEVHAETTRLFIRARRLNARKIHVDEAWAMPSRRKIRRNPIRHFATAGFPRENTWWRAWNARYSGPSDLDAFDGPDRMNELSPVISMRRTHLLALFTTIPTLIAKGLRRPIPERGPKSPNESAALWCLTHDQIGRFFEILLPRPIH